MTASNGLAAQGRRSRRPSCGYPGCPIRPYRGHPYCSEHESLIGDHDPGAVSQASGLPPVRDDDDGLDSRELSLVHRIEELHQAVAQAQGDRDRHPPELHDGEIVGLHVSLVEQEHFRRVVRLGEMIGQRVRQALAQHPEANTLLVQLHHKIKNGYGDRREAIISKNKGDARIIENRLADGRIDVPDYNRRMRMLRKRDKRLMREAKGLLVPESYGEARRLARIRTSIVNGEISKFRAMSRYGLRLTPDTREDALLVQQLRGVFPSDWVDEIPAVRVESTSEPASYMEVRNGVPTITASNESFVTGVHESSHVMERYSASIRSASWAFIRDHATQDNSTIMVAESDGRCVVRRNPRSPFQKPYVGRMYHNNGLFESRSSEVFSTGMEHLFLSSDVTNPASDPTPRGQDKDPTHTNMVLGLLATADIDPRPTSQPDRRMTHHGY